MTGFSKRNGYAIPQKGIFFMASVVAALSPLMQALTKKGDGIIV